MNYSNFTTARGREGGRERVYYRHPVGAERYNVVVLYICIACAYRYDARPGVPKNNPLSYTKDATVERERENHPF